MEGFEEFENLGLRADAPLNRAIQTYDEAEHAFFAASIPYIERPNPANSTSFQNSVYAMQSKFESCVHVTLEDEELSPEEQTTLLTTLVSGSHQRRILIMSELADTEAFEIQDTEEGLSDALQHVLSGPEGAGIAVDGDEESIMTGDAAAAYITVDCYQGNLQSELETLSSLVIASPQAKRVIRNAKLKAHTQEIGTIAAGTAIGGLVVGLILKRFK